MCGITGFIDLENKLSREQRKNSLLAMTTAISHRGPDDQGIWLNRDATVGLGHQRLAVIDLSNLAHQPMCSSDGRYHLIYNGEIYNYQHIRQELQQQSCEFHSTSDTEVLLQALIHWGIEDALKKLNGMFAFALWDNEEQQLFLARDRLGKKPLYWGQIGELFLFGSELKALHKHPGWHPEINRNALTSFLRLSYVPTPYSIFKDINKLPAGCFLALRKGQSPKIQRYYSLDSITQQPINQLSLTEAKHSLKQLLNDAVQCRMLADVPVGTFLSGGIDSSLITALMQENYHGRVKSYSIGFHAKSYNEALYAKAVAKKLGTDHTEFYISDENAQEIIPKLAYIYDEPFADCSQIPTYLVSALARNDVTVVLSGDGGDELFAGYNRYIWGNKINKQLYVLPLVIRKNMAKMIQQLKPESWDSLWRLMPKKLQVQHPGDKLYKLAKVMNLNSFAPFYRDTVSLWSQPENLVTQGEDTASLLFDEHMGGHLSCPISRMQYLDSLMYLPDDILVKVDRASMAVSLESRMPFLDHRLLKFAWQLPMQHKIHNGESKYLLRQLLEDYIPKVLINRPKQGFGVPIDQWLRGSLNEWAADLLAENRLYQEGYLNSIAIQEIWQQHLAKQYNHAPILWNVLMFQMWLEIWKPKPIFKTSSVTDQKPGLEIEEIL